MFGMFIKAAFRSMFRDRITALINLSGMAIAISACVVTFLQVDFGLSKDIFHTNADRIYMLGNVIEHNTNAVTWGSTPVPLGNAIRTTCPSVEKVTRISVKGVTLISGENAFSERVHFVERDFLDMFTFPLVTGSMESFSDNNTIFFTESMAQKYFGDENPVGQQLELITSTSRHQVMTVGGVLRDPPPNSSLQFSALLPYENLARWELLPLDDWEHWTTATFIQMRENENPEQLHTALEPFLQMQREVNGDWGVARLRFLNILDITRDNIFIRNTLIYANDRGSIIMLSAIAMILTLIAGFNYANNRVVSLAKRYREIGIRKVVGSSKFMLIVQFIGENMLFLAFALVAGILLAQYVLIPVLGTLFQGEWSHLALQFSPRTVVFLVSLLLVTSIGAGAYPAFVASRYSPADVFRGASNRSGHNIFLKSMIGLQFFLTFLAIVVPMVLYLNARYQMNLDWGYNQEGVLVIPVNNGTQFERLSNRLESYPGILSIAGSRDHLARFVNIASVEVDGISFETHSMQIGPGYLETLGIRLQDGRTFGEEYTASQAEEVIVNRAFLREHGWEYGVGRTLNIEDDVYSIIGVVEDFHAQDFEIRIAPMVLRIDDLQNMRYLSIRLPQGELTQHAEQIREIFRTILPEVPYDGFFQDETFDWFFRMNRAVLSVFVFSGGSALLIAIMGLFGLVSATIHNREKEIGIRKVLGATVTQVLTLISTPTTRVILIASLLAMAPAWFVTNLLLENAYEYHIELNVTPFIVAFVLLLLVSVVTMLLQSLKVALSNPVDAIRNE